MLQSYPGPERQLRAPVFLSLCISHDAMCRGNRVSLAEAYLYFIVFASISQLTHQRPQSCPKLPQSCQSCPNHFWTSVWPHIGKRNESDLSTMNPGSEKLIAQTTNAIEGFVNFGCIATGILQIIAINFHQTIWKKYSGWLRTVTSTIPSEETVRLVIHEEYFHNFRIFSNTAICRIIMSKSKKLNNNELPLAA